VNRKPPDQTPRRAGEKPLPDRRRKRVLREVLDELLEHVRDVSGSVPEMGRSDLEYAQERLQWLVDEVWRLVLEGPDEESRR
jgi:hypothetical protein